jgi:Ras-related protein Rab-1A
MTVNNVPIKLQLVRATVRACVSSLTVSASSASPCVCSVEQWDTAGQERFRTITAAYYRGAHGIFVTYDITNRHSFDEVPRWAEELDRYCAPSAARILIGCKCDLADTQRQVTTEEAQAIAAKHGMQLFEVSAKSNFNVSAAMDCMVEKMLATRLADVDTEGSTRGAGRIVIQRERRAEAQSCCGGSSAKPDFDWSFSFRDLFGNKTSAAATTSSASTSVSQTPHGATRTAQAGVATAADIPVSVCVVPEAAPSPLESELTDARAAPGSVAVLLRGSSSRSSISIDDAACSFGTGSSSGADSVSTGVSNSSCRNDTAFPTLPSIDYAECTIVCDCCGSAVSAVTAVTAVGLLWVCCDCCDAVML